MSRPGSSLNTTTSRRQALRLGGVTLGLGAIVAACGNERGESEDAGRVGYAPPATDLGDYVVDDVVLLRTASSVEFAAVAVYDAALETGALSSDAQSLAELLRESHREVADGFGELTTAASGVAWECANPWMMERYIEPILESIVTSDDVARDLFTLAVSIENLAAATHQTFAVEFTESDQRVAAAEATAIASRQSATAAIAAGGSDAYVSPALDGEGVALVDGVFPQFAITGQFGSVAQIELVVGSPDLNGTRESYLLQTPAANSYIYAELEPTC